MRRLARWVLYVTLFFSLGCQRSTPAPAAPPVSDFEPWGAPVVKARVLSTLPHDRDSFTQGFLVHQGTLYEGTGRRGKSQLHRINLKTGAIEKQRSLDPAYFGEGLAYFEDSLYQLTWQSETALVYDLEFEPQGQRLYLGEGWGLTDYGEGLLMSNGSPTVSLVKPSNFRILKSFDVIAGDQAVSGLNELEMVEGELWANVYTTDFIARIDPESGKVLGWVDLRGLLQDSERAGVDVLNGIAYDRQAKRLYVTGKLWPKIFEIEVP